MSFKTVITGLAAMGLISAGAAMASAAPAVQDMALVQEHAAPNYVVAENYDRHHHHHHRHHHHHHHHFHWSAQQHAGATTELPAPQAK